MDDSGKLFSTTVSPADVDWSDGLPVSRTFGDIYFSASDGLAETRHVFLAGNRLPERWQTLPTGTFTVAETGFGTGLNFLATCQAWVQSGPASGWLHYISVEKHPLRFDDLARAHRAFPELAPWARLLQQAYPPLLAGHHYRRFEQHRISLHLMFDEALAALTGLLDAPDRPHPIVNAWYLDGFAPKTNPDLWQPALFARMQQLSAADATLATFSAVGEMRRALEANGFAVQRAPGFGRKRHMTCAQLARPAQPTATPAGQWHLPLATGASPERKAIVLGAGIAGWCSAHSLALRGFDVTVIAPHSSDAERASGNRHGILFHRLPAGDSPLARFSQQALLYSHHYYCKAATLPADCTLLGGGTLQLPADDRQARQWQAWSEASPEAASMALWLGADETANPALAGMPLPGPALCWTASATVSPRRICAALAALPGMQYREARITGLDYRNGQWQAVDEHGTVIASAPVVIIACGTASARFAQTQWLPFKPLRGQVSEVPASAQSEQLACSVCHDGYITPAEDGVHCIGATFDLDDDNPALSEASHRDNLERLRQHWPAMHAALAIPENLSRLGGRTGFRYTSPDYLPAVGPVPDHAAFCEHYASLAHNARHIPEGDAPMLPGLYLNTGHGSRGLSYAPLAAELLCAYITGQDRPVEAPLVRALSPARFLERAIKRGTVTS